MSDAAATPSWPSHWRITAIGLALLALLATLVATSELWNARVQGAWFDVYQGVMPRAPSAEPVTVIDSSFSTRQPRRETLPAPVGLVALKTSKPRTTSWM